MLQEMESNGQMQVCVERSRAVSSFLSLWSQKCFPGCT